ncbi:Myb-like DNA-binding domain containing protein [Tritrichomonas foetus]|uniref:Myb-like DNA-binding domain containing protein n=1 Tax=Tritrichomonas foetus TaxID=1144522 RepID=A0A1J4JF10_9EUKA|nr:Myb-like DNA-binding domain containing protein [Tritrichomonas foetus]|eukprot:OHS97730.1 Myb-like DNA-binding domain containing protein [Tritrichomonas foetus]
MKHISPIVNVGVSYILEIQPDISQEKLHILESILSDYLNSFVDYPACNNVFMKILGTLKPLNKIVNIIQTPNTPIPHHANVTIDPTRDIQNKKNSHWTKYENQRLIAGIYRYGVNNWESVAKFVGNGRTKIMCSLRWSRALNPKISKDKWSEEEERKLMNLIEMKGDRSWTYIATQMGNRSDVQCRYHYKQMMKSSNKNIAQISQSFSMPSQIIQNDKLVIPPISNIIEVVECKSSKSIGELPIIRPLNLYH